MRTAVPAKLAHRLGITTGVSLDSLFFALDISDNVNNIHSLHIWACEPCPMGLIVIVIRYSRDSARMTDFEAVAQVGTMIAEAQDGGLGVRLQF